MMKDKNSVGVMVYSNKRDMFSITFPFEILKNYIVWKYDLLTHATQAFKEIIEDKEKEWKKRKINRNQSFDKILLEAEDILSERCMETYWIKEISTYYTCESTKKENMESVKIYKNKIEDIIPEICDALDNYEHWKLDVVNEITWMRPAGYPNMHYQLEKIYSYLNEHSSYENNEWGLIQAEAFSKGFAKTWVIIEPHKMNYNEIKMLTNVACYLEAKDQNDGGKLL